jgi:hypothetical protein
MSSSWRLSVEGNTDGLCSTAHNLFHTAPTVRAPSLAELMALAWGTRKALVQRIDMAIMEDFRIRKNFMLDHNAKKVRGPTLARQCIHR